MNHPPGSGVAPLLQIIFLPIDERREDPYMIETRRENLPGGVRELKLPLRIIAARPRPCTYYSHGQSKQFPLFRPRGVSSPRRLSLPATACPFSTRTTNLFICRSPFFVALPRPSLFNLEPRAFVSTRKHRAPRLIKLTGRGSRRIAQVLISSSPA